jgi:hypothetical protein
MAVAYIQKQDSTKPHLVVDTYLEGLQVFPATPGKDQERTARNFGYRVVTHCATKEMAEEYIERKAFLSLKATEAAVALAAE